MQPDKTLAGQPVPDPGQRRQPPESAGFTAAARLIASRHNVSPKRLCAPGPTGEQLQSLLMLAAAAPDHGLLTPWRFVIVPAGQRHRLGEAFARALIERDPGATVEQLDAAREKAQRSPLLLFCIARLDPDENNAAALERTVSLGAAIQNMLLGAHALGFGAGLTSGQAMDSTPIRQLLHLAADETAVCCLNIGTVTQPGKPARQRPLPDQFVSVLTDNAAPASKPDAS